MLLALSSMQRVQTLKVIDISKMDFFSCSVVIQNTSMLKHFRVNHNSLRIHLKEHSDNPVLCPCNNLKHYIERTSVLRGEVTQILLCFNKPRLPVSCDIISRWLRMVLYEAGTDTAFV